MPSKRNLLIYLSPVIVVLSVVILVFFLHPAESNKILPNASTAGWQYTTPFSYPRRALSAATNGKYIYVIGGINDDGAYIFQTEFARITADGSLDRWQLTSSLPEGRFYQSAVILNGFLYVLGGGQGPIGSDNIPTASVIRANINTDGSLGNWESINYLTTPRRGLKTVAYNNTIYAIGGYNGTFLRSTEHASLNADGSLGDWTSDPQLSKIDRYIHSATLYGDRIYLLGGHVQHDDMISYGDVEMTTINDDHSLAPWKIEKTALQTPRFIASSFALEGYLYILGGHDGGNRLRSVEYTTIASDGHVGQWADNAMMNTERSATAVVTNNHHIYVLGGIADDKVLNSVEMTVQGRHGRLVLPLQSSNR